MSEERELELMSKLRAAELKAESYRLVAKALMDELEDTRKLFDELVSSMVDQGNLS